MAKKILVALGLLLWALALYLFADFGISRILPLTVFALAIVVIMSALVLQGRAKRRRRS
jgi:hypothetical protein